MYQARVVSISMGALLLVAVLVGGCSSGGDDGPEAEASPLAVAAAAVEDAAEGAAGYALKQQVDPTITFTSPVFNEKRRIPKKHTCTKQSGNDPSISPPLAWEGVPDGAKSVALVVDSLEATGNAPRVHWVVWNIPPTMTELAEGVPNTETVPDGFQQGTNDSGTIGYLGPCPPPIVPIAFDTAGGANICHQQQQQIKKYFFNLYALDTEVDLGPQATKDDLLRAVDRHVLATGYLEGERHGKIIRKE